VTALKRVDLPTLGKPTMPALSITRSGGKPLGASRERGFLDDPQLPTAREGVPRAVKAEGSRR